MFSIYSSLFNLKSFDIDYQFILKNWADFIGYRGEIVIAINNSYEDDGYTTQKIVTLSQKYPIRVVYTNIPYSKNTFDGDIKNAALQATSDKFPLKIQMDFDEVIPSFSRPLWDEVADKLLNSPYEAVFVPSIDLYGGETQIRKNHNIGLKWRIHKRGLKRGVWRGAKLDKGLIATDRSDTCELLSPDDELVPTINITPPDFLKPENSHNLRDKIYTFHLGYLNLARRQKLNEDFWSKKWSERSGKPENVIIDLEKLKREDTVPHNLPLWDKI